MYLNAYQKYIDELIDEYGALLERQLAVMVNAKFKTNFKSISAYTQQMCTFSDFKKEPYGNEHIFMNNSVEADFDIIRSFEVMLKFLPNIISHNKSKGNISIRFFVNVNDNNKEICVIPVRQGYEKMISSFVEDKFKNERNEVVIFLLDAKEQIKLINADCNCKFSVVTENGAVFFKK